MEAGAAPTLLQRIAAMTPMEVAKEHVAETRRKRALESDLRKANNNIEKLDERLQELIENEELPASFKCDGASVYTRDQLWASAKDGDHAALVEVLKTLGLRDYLPKTVNSQSLSAYVREDYNYETGEFSDELDTRLLEALNITIKTKVVVNG